MVSVAAEHRDDPEALKTLLYGTDVRARHSETFKRTFGRLLEAAESVDTDEMVRDALLQGSASGLYYRILRHVSGEEVRNPITGRSTPDVSRMA
jgi:hypothetical protein